MEKVIISNSAVLCLNNSFANPNLIYGGCADKTIKVWDISKVIYLSLDYKNED